MSVLELLNFTACSRCAVHMYCREFVFKYNVTGGNIRLTW